MKIEVRTTQETFNETISDVIFTFLKKEKVNYIFGIPGGYNAFLVDALNDYTEVKLIRGQHEEGSAFMADGYARSSGKFGVVLTTAGPGLSNSFTGIISSLADGIPIMHVSGAIPRNKSLRGAIQDTESFRMNISNAFKEATVFHSDIVHKDNFMQYFRNGIRHLFKGKRGPVFFNIGADLFNQTIEHNQEYFHYFPDRYYDKEAADHCLDEIRSSKSLLIIVGHGVIMSNAQREVENLVNLLKVPVIVTPKGKSAVNNEMPEFLGVFGAGSNVIPEKFLENEQIDIILAIGTSFNEYSSNAWSGYVNKASKIIQIDIDPYIIGRSFANTLGVVGDAKTVITYMHEAIRKDNYNPYLHLNATEKIKSYFELHENIIEPEKYYSEATPIQVPRLLKDIYDSFEGHDLNIFNDNGSCIFWGSHYLKLRRDWSYYISLGFSSMGYAIPASIGGAIGAPSKVTVAIAGDGSAIMNGNELKTAAEYNVPVIFVVLNDGRLNIIHHGTNAIFGRPHPEIEYKERLDFVKFAESLGVKGYRIEAPGQINKEFIDELVSKKKPIMLDCWVDPKDMAPLGSRIRQNANE